MSHHDLRYDAHCFQHIHSAHCESGVTSSLLTNGGVPLSEPMVFGIGSGLIFAHFPFLKVMEVPVTTYRSMPGSIFNNLCRRLGIRSHRQRFRNQDQGQKALNYFLERGHPVGLQTNIYWLSYFSKQFRFQFNGHNLIAVRKLPEGYEVSDPVIDTLMTCPEADLAKARFAKGPFAPRGLIYFPTATPKDIPLQQGIYRGIRSTSRLMLYAPGAFVGVTGIRYLGKRIKVWARQDFAKARLYLGQVVRMQEEIGTGGAGFRFMYAAFLEEAYRLLALDFLHDCSKQLTAAGDCWRQFAVASAKLCKQSSVSFNEFAEAASLLDECAEKELIVFKTLNANLRHLKGQKSLAALTDRYLPV